MPPPHLPTFYRIWFTTIDPLCILLTIHACIFTPSTAYAMLIPPTIQSYNPVAHAALLYQAASLFSFIGIMAAVLLRLSDDPVVWRTVQVGILAVDVGLILTGLANQWHQGRLEVEEWRGVDWMNFLFTVLVAGIRGAFLGGIGENKGTKLRA